MKQLISFLGAGKLEGEGADRRYREADYFFQEHQTGYHRSPFVLDAVLTLKKERFNTVHILGTRSSMWETLLWWLYTESEQEKFIDQVAELESLCETENLTLEVTQMATIKQRLEQRWENVEAVHLHLVPHGKNAGEMQETLAQIIGLVNMGDAITLDVTHGYRHLPMLNFLATYFFTVVNQVKVEHLYYGALDMRHQFAGRTPILDLSEVVLPFFQWINAGAQFMNTGDTAELAELLPENRSDVLDSAKSRLRSSAASLQYNQLSDMHKRLVNIKEDLTAADPGDLPPPMRALMPAINARLSDYSKQSSEPEFLVQLAQQYYRDGQKAQALIVAADAAESHMAEKLGITEEKRKDKANSRELKKIMNEQIYDLSKCREDKKVKDFGKLILDLKGWRNAVSHFHLHLSSSDVDRQLPEKLDQLEDHLHNTDITPHLDKKKIIKIEAI